MTIIQKGDQVMTLVNVFTVEPKDQLQLIDVLVEATTRTMKHLPGFVSASIHRSLDGTRVVNYAQWRSKVDFDAMRSNVKAVEHMNAASALAKADPIVCEVVESVSA